MSYPRKVHAIGKLQKESDIENKAKNVCSVCT